MIRSVTAAEFESSVIRSDRPVVVDFWASWCAPCRMIGPALEALAEEMGERARFFRLDVDRDRGLADQLGLQVFPTVMIFTAGRVAATQVGYRHDLRDLLARDLAPLVA